MGRGQGQVDKVGELLLLVTRRGVTGRADKVVTSAGIRTLPAAILLYHQTALVTVVSSSALTRTGTDPLKG